MISLFTECPYDKLKITFISVRQFSFTEGAVFLLHFSFEMIVAKVRPYLGTEATANVDFFD